MSLLKTYNALHLINLSDYATPMPIWFVATNIVLSICLIVAAREHGRKRLAEFGEWLRPRDRLPEANTDLLYR